MRVQPATLAIGLLLTVFCVRPAVSAEPHVAEAARSEDWSRVAQLLQQKADVNVALDDGSTGLHWTVWHDNARVTADLLAQGANPKVKNEYGVTPLSLACVNGNHRIVDALLRAGAKANTVMRGGETVLMTAARTGRKTVVRRLLMAGADVNRRERSGQTALMWAAAEGHEDVVADLLDAGADHRVTVKSGFNALFFAVREGRQSAVEVLLDAGVDVNSVMSPTIRRGRTPRSGTSPLLLAIENGHFSLAVALLERGADANDQRSGFTALHALTWTRKPNLGDGLDGQPPPSGTGKTTSLDLVRVLVEHGADVNRRLKKGRAGRGRLNHKGATPFLFAADTADVRLMQLLLELGADPLLANADDCPPLLAACGIGTIAPGEEAGTEEEAVAAATLLLDLGANINHVDKNGETAMHGAAYKSLPKMVRLLADHGADIDVWHRPNKSSWTPLHIAEGHRVGNFKPAPATIVAIHDVMRRAGMTPPKPRPRRKSRDY